MKKNTISEKVYSFTIKMTQILLFTILMTGSLSMDAQMKYFLNENKPGVQGTLVRIDFDNADGDDDHETGMEFDIESLDVSGFGLAYALGMAPITGGDILGDPTFIDLDGPGDGGDNYFPYKRISSVSGPGDTTWNSSQEQVLYLDGTLINVGTHGAWYGNPGDGFIAVRFPIGANTHYGWIHVTITNDNDWQVNAWAYNETPNEATYDMNYFLNENKPGVQGTLVRIDFDNADGDDDHETGMEFDIESLDVSGFGLAYALGMAPITGGDILGDPTFIDLDGPGDGGDNYFPYKLASGESNPSLTTWNSSMEQVLYLDGTLINVGTHGAWYGNPGDGFIAVRFPVGADTHYGWIHVTITDDNSWQVNAWAYDVAPNNSLSTQKNEFDSNILAYAKDNKVTIKNLPEDADYTLYSLTGQSIQEGVAQRDNAEFSVSTIANGIYILKAVGQESGKLFTAKLAF